MGVGLSTAMYNGRTGMLAREKQMNVLANNMAHVDDADYHKQTVNMENGLVVKTSAGYYGTGVQVNNVSRNFNASMENSYRSALSDQGYYTTYTDSLDDVQNMVTDGAVSPLATQIQGFADALQKVASLPEDEGERYSLLNKAQLVANQFNAQYSSLGKIRDDLANATSGAGSIQDTVSRVNSLLTEVADLNNEIYISESFKFRPQKDNDTRDKRDGVIKELSSLVDVQYTELGNAAYQVSIGGQVVISAQRPQDKECDTINMTMTGLGPHFTPTLTWNNAAVPANVSNGELKGFMDARAYTTEQMDTLWTYAQNFAGEINIVHNGGFDLDGNPGTDMFDAATAGQMNVLTTSSRAVAASASGELGDGSNALNIWNQMNTPLNLISDDTLLNHADRLASTISANYNFADEMKSSADSSSTMFKDSISERTGVSNDEEMAKMLEIQRAYQASAKFISAVDSMLQAIIAMA